MKVIVTGGRDFNDVDLIWKVLNSFPLNITTIVHGNCPTGLDSHAKEWCQVFGVDQLPYDADWTKFGRSAGPKRNIQMIEENMDAFFLLSFPGGKGTRQCTDHAFKVKMGIIFIDKNFKPI
jgi:hypothetical protein